ncbi:MAG TPA: biotin/lipoyl-binding protein, partial [Pirellulales bacterium]
MIFHGCNQPASLIRPILSRRGTGAASSLLLAMMVLGCTHAAPSPAPVAEKKEAAPKDVLLSRAEEAVWPESVRVQGSLMGDEQSVVASKVAGRVVAVRVDLGTSVKKGDVLAEIDPQDFDLKIQQAKALLAQACAAVGSTPDKPDDSLDRMKSPPIVLEIALNEEAAANLRRGEQLFERKATSSEELQTRRALY